MIHISPDSPGLVTFVCPHGPCVVIAGTSDDVRGGAGTHAPLGDVGGGDQRICLCPQVNAALLSNPQTVSSSPHCNRLCSFRITKLEIITALEPELRQDLLKTGSQNTVVLAVTIEVWARE